MRPRILFGMFRKIVPTKSGVAAAPVEEWPVRFDSRLCLSLDPNAELVEDSIVFSNVYSFDHRICSSRFRRTSVCVDPMDQQQVRMGVFPSFLEAASCD